MTAIARQHDVCETPVVRRSHRGRPPRYCGPHKSSCAADVRSKPGASCTAPPQPHMPAEERRADRVLLIEYVLDHGPVEGIYLDEAEVFEHLMGAIQVPDRRDNGVRYIRRATLRMPVMDLAKEAFRGPRTTGACNFIRGGTDEYYERKRSLGLIADERATS